MSQLLRAFDWLFGTKTAGEEPAAGNVLGGSEKPENGRSSKARSTRPKSSTSATKGRPKAPTVPVGRMVASRETKPPSQKQTSQNPRASPTNRTGGPAQTATNTHKPTQTQTHTSKDWSRSEGKANATSQNRPANAKPAGGKNAQPKPKTKLEPVPEGQTTRVSPGHRTGSVLRAAGGQTAVGKGAAKGTGAETSGAKKHSRETNGTGEGKDGQGKESEAKADEGGVMHELVRATDWEAVVATRRFAVVKFGRPRCPPCAAVQPYFAALIKENPSVHGAEVNSVAFAALADAYDVDAYPTFVFFRQGRPDHALTVVGADRPALKAALAALQR